MQLYDKINIDVVDSGTTFPTLNNYLFSVLLNKAKDKPLKFIQELQHLWGDGVAILHERRRAYYGLLTKLEIKELQSSLLSPQWSRSPTESIDTFAARTLCVRRDLKDHGVFIEPDILKECFIMGLGPDFTDVQKDLQWDRLHDEWSPIDIIHLIEPARKVLKITTNLHSNNQKYKQAHSPKKSSSTPSSQPDSTNNAPTTKPNDDTSTNNIKQRKAQQQKIRETIKQGTFKIADFQSQVPENACVYHGWLHKNQPNSTKHCNIVKDLLQEAAASLTPPTKPMPTSDSSTGPSHNDIDELNDALDTLTQFNDQLDNNNNKAPKHEYFASTVN